MRVAVIGSGLLGVTSAYFLKRHGMDVTVVERRDAAALETSFANGGYLQFSAPDPWNAPGLGKLLLKSWLAGLGSGSEEAPLLVRSRALPGLFRWGLRFLSHARRQSYLDSTLRNMRLAGHTRDVLAQLRKEEKIDYKAAFGGAILVFRSAESFAAYKGLADFAGEHGAEFRMLDRDGIAELEPSLSPVADELCGGIYYPDDEYGDARIFCEQLARAARQRGAVFEYGVTVKELRRAGQAIHLLTDKGAVSAEAVVIAAGSYSEPLAGQLGLKLPIAPGKGYSISIPMEGWQIRPKHVVGDMVLHAGVTPLGEILRVAGTAEFTGFDLRISAGRVRNLIHLVEQIFPEFAAIMDRSAIQSWTALRPMSADGVPIIGATPVPNVYLNTGHGALGWTHAAGSGKALADLIAGSNPSLDLAPYSISRFH